jgi:hypothetical protein
MSPASVAECAAVVLVALVIGGSRRRRSTSRVRGSRSPKPGEIWFASFPFAEDWTKAKDRPVLVLSVAPHTAVVRKITSQDQSHRPQEYDLLPRDISGLPHRSWIKKAPDYISLGVFRRRASRVTTSV